MAQLGVPPREQQPSKFFCKPHHGLALQSTKLSVYEERVMEIVDSTKDLPELLATTGKVRDGVFCVRVVSLLCTAVQAWAARGWQRGEKVPGERARTAPSGAPAASHA